MKDDLIVEKIDYKGHTITIGMDDWIESPRRWDNIGTIVAFHSRYNLSDKSAENMTKDEAITLTKRSDLIVYPLFMYEHSAIALSLSNTGYPFNDRFDAGQVGFIYCTKEKALDEFHGGKVTKGSKVTKKVKDYIYNHFKSEIETYADFLNGNVYAFDVEGDLCDDSCSGYFGFEGKKEAIKTAKESIDSAIEFEEKERTKSESIMHL